MKRTYSLIFIAAILTLAVISGGCVDTVNPPPPAVITGTPAYVQVSLTSSTIVNGSNTNVTVTVTDSSSRVVPNTSVSFSVISSTAGSFSTNPGITNGSGQATTLFTAASPAGDNSTATIRATVTVGASTIFGSAQITIGTPPQVPSSVVVSLGSPTIANSGSTTATATVRDASSALISGATVTFSVSPSASGSFTPATAVTNGAGVATVTFTAAAAGDDSMVDIGATAGAVSNTSPTRLTIGSPPAPTPASMSLAISPLSITISGTATVSVTLRDASGNPAYNNGVSLLITGGTGTGSFSPIPPVVSAVTVTTNTSGVATATFYAGTTSGTVNIQATAGALPSKSASLIITSDPDSISLSVGSSDLVNGQSTSVTADVRNVLGQAVSNGTTVTFALTYAGSPPGALSSTTAFTVASLVTGGGMAQVTFTADASNTGPVFVTASAGTTTVITSSAQLINVNPAQAGSLEYVSVDPAGGVINIVGAGTSDATVKFKVLSVTGAALPGVSVAFQLYGPTGATLDTGGLVTSSGVTNSLGEVTTILHAGLVAGSVRIVATTTVSGNTLTTSSGSISIGGGLPSDRFFSTSVTKLNIDGLYCDNVKSTINVLLADRFGNYNILQGTSVSFATDAGAIDTSNVTDATGATTAIFRSQAPRPTDVTPLVTEPSYTIGARTYNPRDGWLTILVSTTGEEHFVDENPNGVYDSLPFPGETFTDIPEPFIDSDDSATRDTGELFFDWPSSVPLVTGCTTTCGAGKYDVPNGVWDSRIPIFREVNLVMTGPPNVGTNTTRIVNSTLGTGAVTIPRGSSETFYVYVSDINMNALISGTKVSLGSDKTEASVVFSGGSETLLDVLSYGPAIVEYRVTNNNTSSPAVSVFPLLSATIDWPGTCGALKVTLSYPGIITLL